MFVRQGLADKIEYDALGSTDGGAVLQLGYLAGKLSRFRQHGPWDAQRVGGKFNPAYVDYATIAIGLYSAALGISQNEILTIEDLYASRRSEYEPGTGMDKKYKHLPEKNVINTNIGCQFYKSNSITDR